MRSSLARLAPDTAPTRTLSVGKTGTVASLLRRPGILSELGLGERRPPARRRLREADPAAIPASSRIVLRAGSVSLR